jgi:hypothetical protein
VHAPLTATSLNLTILMKTPYGYVRYYDIDNQYQIDAKNFYRLHFLQIP